MFRIFKRCTAASNIERMTSPQFHRSVSAPVIAAELNRLCDTLNGRGAPLSKEVDLEIGVVMKHVTGIEAGAGRLVKPLSELAACMTPDRTSHLRVKVDFDLILGSIISRLASDPDAVHELVQSADTEEMRTILKKSTDSQFFAIMDLVNQYLGAPDRFRCPTPPSLIRLIPDIESEILRRSPKSGLTLKQAGIVIDTIGRFRMTNSDIFKIVIDTVLAAPPQVLLKEMRASTALKLLRELGWAGLTHSELLTRVGPLFHPFRNYQALTSVFMIAGGLNETVVDACMRVIRQDITNKNARYPVSIVGHCQVIRRLVVCGFYSEAMEMFAHFPPGEYTALTDITAISQIHRLFLASFLRPDIVPREAVDMLKRTANDMETTHVVYRSEASGTENGQHGIGSSFIHNLVVNALNRLKISHVSEYSDPESLLDIDIYVPSLKLAIEVQGPSHFVTDLATGVSRLRPEDEFKLAVMRTRGMHVEQLSVYDFGRHNATRNADAKIRQLVQQYGWTSPQ